jgi:hypothetical protein
MYWTVLIVALAGLALLGVVAAQELSGPYPATAKRTLVAAWLVAAAATAWWAARPGAAPLVVAVCGFAFLAATLNRKHEPAAPPVDDRRTPYQPPR